MELIKNRYGSGFTLQVEAHVSAEEVLDAINEGGIDLDDIVDHFGEDEILNHIGKDKAMAHFNLVEEPTE